MKHFFVIICTVFLFFSACKTVPVEVDKNISQAELFQQAQTALDNSNYKAAEFYYEQALILFKDDISAIVTAEYELAHMYVKQKKCKEAVPLLEKILTYYDDDSLASQLPAKYKKLVMINLKQCEKKAKK